MSLTAAILFLVAGVALFVNPGGIVEAQFHPQPAGMALAALGLVILVVEVQRFMVRALAALALLAAIAYIMLWAMDEDPLALIKGLLDGPPAAAPPADKP